MERSTHRVRACSLREVPPGTARRLDTLPRIAIFNVNGTVYAVEDVCAHEFAVLSEGHFDGISVECPLHMSRFDVRTGEPLCLPATEPLRTYKVEVIDDDVFVHIETGGHN
ncbi:bifunctional 3-phenylpropionate/cinnamic acid dioxygenase ferredoxin subunit [Saccharopolyspora hattusasensis]|uniref:bifunctional 3-phenylpropionate/cinnamic acid dioxygenase ferredoxin subunit n=1 Tax=Saccharopolyspora hattusasensis TaxID=1128679 RepID=UPI003D97C93D